LHALAPCAEIAVAIIHAPAGTLSIETKVIQKKLESACGGPVKRQSDFGANFLVQKVKARLSLASSFHSQKNLFGRGVFGAFQ
jgi:hypothetical protein